MVKNEGNVEIGVGLPYPISYRSIVPSRVECTNLIVPVCLSASHIAYGSIRMEPVFMVLGQVSGLAACLASEAKSDVQDSEGDQVIPQGKWDKVKVLRNDSTCQEIPYRGYVCRVTHSGNGEPSISISRNGKIIRSITLPEPAYKQQNKI